MGFLCRSWSQNFITAPVPAPAKSFGSGRLWLLNTAREKQLCPLEVELRLHWNAEGHELHMKILKKLQFEIQQIMTGRALEAFRYFRMNRWTPGVPDIELSINAVFTATLGLDCWNRGTPRVRFSAPAGTSKVQPIHQLLLFCFHFLWISYNKKSQAATKTHKNSKSTRVYWFKTIIICL
jgi:hypothetical protein